MEETALRLYESDLCNAAAISYYALVAARHCRQRLKSGDLKVHEDPDCAATPLNRTMDLLLQGDPRAGCCDLWQRRAVQLLYLESAQARRVRLAAVMIENDVSKPRIPRVKARKLERGDRAYATIQVAAKQRVVQ